MSLWLSLFLNIHLDVPLNSKLTNSLLLFSKHFFTPDGSVSMFFSKNPLTEYNTYSIVTLMKIITMIDLDKHCEIVSTCTPSEYMYAIEFEKINKTL